MAPNQRDPKARIGLLIAVLCAVYTTFHLVVMVLYPLETWTYRMIHLCGGLVIGFLTYSALVQSPDAPDDAADAVRRSPLTMALMAVAVGGIGYGFAMIAYA
ncbi:MAG: TRAP transporter permease, partial [Paracoccus sp. (in: a-proteobacteria)]